MKHLPNGRLNLAQLEAKAHHDTQYKKHDKHLERAQRPHGATRPVKHQDDEDVHDGNGAARHERHLDEDVERNGGADDLGDVGSDDGALGEEIQDVVEPRGEVRFAVLGEVHAGDGAELDAEGLKEDGEDVGHEDDEKEFEAEGGAGGDVGGIVSWVVLAI